VLLSTTDDNITEVVTDDWFTLTELTIKGDDAMDVLIAV